MAFLSPVQLPSEPTGSGRISSFLYPASVYQSEVIFEYGAALGMRWRRCTHRTVQHAQQEHLNSHFCFEAWSQT